MRVLFTTWAWSPHYFPMVPLAWALRNAGHEVRVAGQPGIIDPIVNSGLPAVSVGKDIDFVETVRQQMGIDGTAEMTPERWRELRKGKGKAALRIFVDLAEAMVDDLVDFGRAWRPDLVVHTPSGFAGPLTAAALGVPNVRHLKAPDIAYPARELEVELLEPLRKRLGISAPVDPIGALTVDPCPPRMQVPSEYPRQLIRYIPYNGPGVMPDWLLEPAERPRVCVTWGTTLGRLNPNMVLAGTMLRAIAELDVEVVATVAPGHAALVGDLPAGVRLVESLPLHMLLPTCDAIVHQGGTGTTMTSLVCGVPQLIVPQFPDHAFNAARLAGAGGGIVLMPEDADPEAVRAHVRRLLDDEELRASVRSLHDEAVSQQAPTEIVGVLEDLAARSPHAPAHS
ncbi:MULTISPECIES: nucleotide disphospho-sugar-binding domain-containing protein [unclassified Nonomuraea]|uniref:nucleotide disphospho-sugar-binding domain-containing protein n=1 Tax=unclassified Nonomuraea TaxID=2593643 RepID=UPI0033CDE307